MGFSHNFYNHFIPSGLLELFKELKCYVNINSTPSPHNFNIIMAVFSVHIFISPFFGLF
ncbi:hypothetical protein KsCSTR_30120 [Candidatus Kuenenia stuttgartiensis]|uniref:Uncharacterized protein n=1 Tax=Kuenenia stuttgartiensis TaxID=174633 RepID=Q1Q5I9_KUEST|nr:hypothetical protein KsCSTR_30120 [Candidatus Kuenenia stuttgartiensis]CAJ75288.1 unknown protein [Candidatus Kuenenia stuttgartiensis]